MKGERRADVYIDRQIDFHTKGSEPGKDIYDMSH